METIKHMARLAAQAVQEQAGNHDRNGTERRGQVYPRFPDRLAEKENMLNRPVGFVCKSTAGRVVKLLQKYDSTIYTAEPEELPAQWGFVWSNDPEKAKPFIALSTSPYMKGNCCTEDGAVYRSTIDNNVWSPSAYPQGWEKVTACYHSRKNGTDV